MLIRAFSFSFSFAAMVALAILSHAAEPAKVHYDWTKAASGDVTREMSGNLDGDVLNLGKGKIHFTKSTKLTKAEVDPFKLTLIITMSEAEQLLRFEDMAGTFGGYQPHEANLRGVSITNSPHTERFIRKGVLTISVLKPDRPRGGLRLPPKEDFGSEVPRYQAFPGQPEQPKVAKPMPLLPGPETGYKPRSKQYAELAAAISGKYEMPGRSTLRSYERQWQEAAEAAARYPVAEIRKRGEKMLAVAKSERNVDLAAVRKDLLADAEEAENRKIAFGTVRGYERDSLGNEIPILARGNEADPSGIERARELRNLAAMSDEKLRSWAIGNQRQNGFGNLLFGDGMTNHPDQLFQNLVFDARPILEAEAKKHAGPKSQSPLVGLFRPDAATIKVKNASDKTLTDAMVFLSCGFTNPGEAKRFGAPIMLFVPLWKADEELELKFEFKEPTVMHAKAMTFANEAAREGDEFTLQDPERKNPVGTGDKRPDPSAPGVVVLRSKNPLSKDAKAWAIIDGKRVEWKVGERTLELPATAGEHKIVVRLNIRNRTLTILEKTVVVNGGERSEVPLLVR